MAAETNTVLRQAAALTELCEVLRNSDSRLCLQEHCQCAVVESAINDLELAAQEQPLDCSNAAAAQQLQVALTDLACVLYGGLHTPKAIRVVHEAYNRYGALSDSSSESWIYCGLLK